MRRRWSFRERIEFADDPAFGDAIRTGEIREGLDAVLVPVRSDGNIVGLLMIAGAPRPSEDERDAYLNLAGIIAFGIRHAATVDELQQEAERSRGLERLKGEFLNIAAHELRSPLGIIRGYASMLGEGMVPEPDRATAVARIAEKAEEMARLISGMLETARLETLGLELELEPVDLVEVVEAALAEMRPLLGVNHRFAPVKRREAIVVVADRMRLTTLLTNLIDNAIKYSPAGGAIEVDCEHDDHAARVVVRDHGIGINEEQAHMLFTRFGRLVTPETSHIRGTGLGLYLARETARLHGGDIHAELDAGRWEHLHRGPPTRIARRASGRHAPGLSSRRRVFLHVFLGVLVLDGDAAGAGMFRLEGGKRGGQLSLLLG